MNEYRTPIKLKDTLTLKIKINCKKEQTTFYNNLRILLDSSETWTIHIEAKYPPENKLTLLNGDFTFYKSKHCDSVFVKDFKIVNISKKPCQIKKLEEVSPHLFDSKYEILTDYSKPIKPNDTLILKIKLICKKNDIIYARQLYMEVEDDDNSEWIVLQGLYEREK